MPEAWAKLLQASNISKQEQKKNPQVTFKKMATSPKEGKKGDRTSG